MATHQFTLNGQQYTLTTEQVEAAVRSARPENIQELAVAVNGQWWPVKQPFGAAIGQPSNEFNSRRAFDILRRLGFELHDPQEDGERPATPGGGRTRPGPEQRGKALELAVAHCAGRDRAVAEVLQIAGEFLAWMTEGR